MTLTDSSLIVAEDLPIITPNRDVVVSSLTLKVKIYLELNKENCWVYRVLRSDVSCILVTIHNYVSWNLLIIEYCIVTDEFFNLLHIP